MIKQDGRFKWVWIPLIWLISFTATAHTIIYSNIHLQKKSNVTEIILTSNDRPQYHQFILKNPLRFVVDLRNAALRQSVDFLPIAKTAISTVRTAVHPGKLQRLVFDMRRPTALHSFVRFSENTKQYQLVLQFKSSGNKANTSSKETLPQKLSHNIRLRQSAIVPDVPQVVATANQFENTVANKQTRNIIVVIDPGHGGKDPGATGINGTHEKNVVLSISRYLQRDIDRQPGFKAVLTRNSDYFISLRGRLAIARRYKADMFIAIHADAYRNHRAHGVSVFALSQRGATSEAARWLAARENKSELMGGVDLADKSNILKSVLLNLSQTATIRSSLMIGQDLIHTIRQIATLHHSSVEQAAFVVLKSPDIPSLLVETGFLSNPYEERRLDSPQYRQKIALALMRGIKQYFVHHPSPNTWLALWRDQKHNRIRHYLVVRGDTLTGIADRFHVTLRDIRSMNHIASNDVKIGQKLLIPRT